MTNGPVVHVLDDDESVRLAIASRLASVGLEARTHGTTQAFLAAETSSLFGESLELAQQRVDEGRGEELIEIHFPLPLLITARGYLDKYGPGERYNLLTFIEQVRSPLLITFGSLEVEQGSIAFAGLAEAVGHATAAKPDWPGTVEVIQGADHHYSDRRGELGKLVSSWLSD